LPAQKKGAIDFVLSSAPRNQITLNKGVVEQNNYNDREPAHIHETGRETMRTLIIIGGGWCCW